MKRNIYIFGLAIIPYCLMQSELMEPLIKSIIAPLSNGFSSGVIDGCAFNQRFLNRAA
ncbi:MAG: hypothetical protein J6A37_16425 [Oscillospiraceae bacterium]|nr:hypothetical protein [Oscillospiraceae bacterium]